MKTAALAATLLVLAACTPAQQDNSAREWAKSECNRVIDSGDRERCLKRVADQYGGAGPAERREPPKR